MTAIGHQEWKVVTRKAGPVVPVDVAPDELLNKMMWLREKPVPTDIMHGQPLPKYLKKVFGFETVSDLSNI